MKNLILTFSIVAFFSDASCQLSKLIIKLKDKAGNSYSVNNPSQYLSQKAITRRTRFNISVDSTDLPITTAYIQSISTVQNVKILSSSKWLNEVLVETTDPKAIDKINAFSFVNSSTPVGLRMSNSQPGDKVKETIRPLSATHNRVAKSLADTINYGNSYEQVHMHEGDFLHNKGFQGQSMQITVLDAGFSQYRSINAFDSIRLNSQVLGERDFVNFDNSVNEDDTHGMYCLSILAANWPGKMVGTAPKANYWLVRTENAASEYPIEEHNWVVGAEFADSTGSDMISSSLGYSIFDAPGLNHSHSQLYKNQTDVSKGAALATKKGIIVMNSAGNEGDNAWRYLVFPADADSVCAVGAVDSAGVVGGFSSIGYEGKVKPNIVSLGVGTVIAGINNEPTSGSGTSFANPNVAGLIACLWQAFPAYNNMKILDAVYKSSDRYASPNASYGYGIPNFRKAYQLLKHDENVSKFENEWFFATPNPFTSQIDIKFVGRIDGNATVSILNEAGQVIAQQAFITEKEELYSYSFSNLINLPPGHFTIRYADSNTTQNIILRNGNNFIGDWLIVAPNPFKDNLTVSLKALQTGEISLRLLDAKGRMLELYTVVVNEGEVRSIRFKVGKSLPKGMYFLQYVDKNQKKVIRLLKG